MKGMKIGEAIAGLAILLNVLMLFAWGAVRPTARYEQSAFDRLQEAKKANRGGDPERAFTLFDDVAGNFPRSNYSERALFMAARTALRGLGRADLAAERFHRYLKIHPRGDYSGTAKRYLDLIDCSAGIPAETRDSAVWELVQADQEYENGRFFESLNRCEWIMVNYKNTDLQAKAQEIAETIRSEANQYYVSLSSGQTLAVEPRSAISLDR